MIVEAGTGTGKTWPTFAVIRSGNRVIIHRHQDLQERVLKDHSLNSIWAKTERWIHEKAVITIL